MIRDLVRDSAYALRLFVRDRSFTLVAVVTLALGIGATTAIFSVVNGVLLQPLPYPDPDQIVSIGTRSTRTGKETPRVTGGDLVDLCAQHQLFEAASPHWGGEIGVQTNGVGEFAGVQWVAPAFFQVFRVQPVAGRIFGERDGEQATVIGEGLAERVFGSPANALGKSISVEDQGYTIAGVLPRRFTAPDRTDVWLPIPSPLPRIAKNRTAFNFKAVARLRPDVSLHRAQAGVTTLGARLAASFPDSNRDRSFTITPMRDRVVARVRTTLLVLLTAVSLVLLIACANVANLLLARSTTRTREMGLRAALGASRWRIVRQLIAESLVLSLAGTGLGLAVAFGGTKALVRLAPANLPRLDEVSTDWRVLTFALVCSLAASLVFGMAPAWHASRVDLNATLKQAGSRGLIGGRHRLRGVLVASEIALAFVLAVSAGLLFRSFMTLTEADLGFRPDSVLVVSAHAPAKTLEDYVRVARTFERLAPELSPVPGVRAVGAVMGLPTGQYGSNGAFSIEGRPAPSTGERSPEAGFRLAGPGYFAALGVPILDGRDFTDHDRHDGPFVAIVSRSLAERDFRGETPIGRRIRCGLDAPDTWMTIVGVVGDVRQDSPGATPGPEIYMPLEQHPYHANELQVVVRTSVDPESLVPALRKRLHRLNPSMALKFTTLERLVSATVETQRFRAWLVGGFAGLALLLAMAGVYGVMAYIAAQRTPEFGLRLALGATPPGLFRLVVSRAMRMALVGVGAGLLLSLAAGRVLGSLLTDIQPLGSAAYVVAVCGVTSIVLTAAGLPAWRASKVNPIVALRDDR